ncbi:MAG: hypothetical protein L3K16_09760 [Thermoplasmata archaeon]|nr:hypothetical protein [Thermoplasmata archaeon]
MDYAKEIVFLGELHDQCLAADRAFTRIKWAIQLHAKPQSERQRQLADPQLDAFVHDAVCTFLDACAIVSKLLKPAPARRDPDRAARAEARGAELLRNIGVSEDAEFMPRDVRDAVEHIDERLDEWMASGNRPFPETWVIIWPGEPGSWEPVDGLRTFDARSMEVSVLGSRCNIEGMHEGLVRLDQRLNVSTSDLSFSVTEPGKPPNSISIRMATGRKPPNEG